MSLSKKIYEEIKYEEENISYDESGWVDRVLYTKDKLKESSLKTGDGSGFDSQRLSSR
jgi:hypothetical protein